MRIVPPTWQNRLLKQIEQPWLALCQTLVHTHLDAQSALMLLNHPQLSHITYLRPCNIRNSVDSSYTQCLKLNTIERLHGLRCDGASKFERTLQDERLSDLRMLRLSSHHQTNQLFTTPSPWHQSIQVLHLDRARFLPLDELIVLDLPQLKALMLHESPTRYSYETNSDPATYWQTASQSTTLPQLKTLALSFFRSPDLQGLIEYTDSLTHLCLSDFQTEGVALSELIPKSRQTQLEALSITHTYRNLGKPDLHNLQLDTIKTLCLGQNRLSSKTLQQCFEQPWFARIKNLDLHDNKLHHTTVQVMAKSGIRPHVLNLNRCDLEPNSFKTLAASGVLDKVHHLSLHMAHWSSECIELLFGHAPSLRTLVLNQKHISDFKTLNITHPDVHIFWTSLNNNRLWPSGDSLFFDITFFAPHFTLYESIHV